jgi:hypothetical protein
MPKFRNLQRRNWKPGIVLKPLIWSMKKKRGSGWRGLPMASLIIRGDVKISNFAYL